MLTEKEGWLVGWKSISRYIGKHPNTAKKYHVKYGMPVRRDPGGGAVALKYELGRWLIEFDELMKKYNGKAYEHLAKRFKKSGKINC